ncbi:TadE/TadG family type IV pilus assembly protein [Paenibacillus sp. sgz500958]|uniref:TadE/TadG family type IV pilus assembly protein n=1 Tax=Paenibacillus sp. sgz500958 TaxID=3242475 RepID=UPI0036D3EB58
MKFCGNRRTTKGNSEGSMTVEAAMVLPLFLLFVLFLISIVQMTLYSTALQATVSDTVKVVSSHMYPAALAVQKWNGTSEQGQAGGGTESSNTAASTGEAEGQDSSLTWGVPRLSLTDWSESYVSSLPEPLDEWVKAALSKGEGPLQELQAEASESVLDLAVKPMLKPYLSSDFLNYEHIHVSNIIVPDLKSGGRPYFGLEVSYELPMKIPFLNKGLVLESKAIERVWIGDTGEGGSGSDQDDDENQNAIEILEKPSPGIAGKKGVVRAKIPPNSSAYLSVLYKSGKSTAKHLGWVQADSDGYIKWEWKIGSNTTPGVWSFVTETDDGQTLEVPFTVVNDNWKGNSADE